MAKSKREEFLIHPTHNHSCLLFPSGFLWGSATSAYQVEGGNEHSDWWHWEKTHHHFESGDAAKQYELYELDFNLAKDLNQNSHRLSLEWSRIEPEKGVFDYSAIEHYRDELKSLKAKGFTVMLTLWHFTLPQWVAEEGGWENSKTIGYFEDFIKTILPQVQEYVDMWITLNEPGVYAFQGYLLGLWPPQKKSKWKTMKVYWNLAQAHKKAYKIIHTAIPNAQVGISNNVGTFEAFHRHSIREAVAEYFLDTLNHLFYKLSGVKTHDFFGINYYFNQYLSFNKTRIIPTLVDISTTKKSVSDLGWEIYPQGIFDILVDFSDYHKPIYITENGIASTNDDRRVRFLISYLEEIYHAIAAGADVRGYFYWSLIDNFEWADGYKPRFGLIEVDYETQKRKIRPSAYVYQDITSKNSLCHPLLKLLGHGIHVDNVMNTGKIEKEIKKVNVLKKYQEESKEP